MGLFKHFRSKSNLRNKTDAESSLGSTGPDYSSRLSQKLLENIFTYVCPNAEDKTYTISEMSIITAGCVSCDYRDLAHCALVCKSWWLLAQDLLYESARIDAVHYCDLEEILSEKRRRKSSFNRNAVEPDIPSIRLQLFQRTVRNNPTIAAKVHFLKLPYMTRETCVTDLARTVSVLSNLRYVDLPEGFWGRDDSCATLRQELNARCPDLCWMRYTAGSEFFFEHSVKHDWWPNVESVELSGLDSGTSITHHVLSSREALRQLKLRNLSYLTNEIFHTLSKYGSLEELPPLQKLELENLPGITAEGLTCYLSRPETRNSLSSLSVSNTGITVPALHNILSRATHLTYLSIQETVAHPLPLGPIPLLTSITLRVLNFEINSSQKASHGLQKPSDSFYAYLTSSLHSASLPALRSLYVRDPDFPESLLLVPPTAPFASETAANRSAGFRQPLDIYTKGADTLDWVYTPFRPASPTSSLYPSLYGDSRNRRMSVSQSISRPVSAYEATRGPAGPNWAGEARKSTIVGNGTGDFLAVPVADDTWTSDPPHERERFGSVASQGSQASRGSWLSPKGSHERRASKHDLWR